MAEPRSTTLEALAASLHDTHPPGFVDLYIERVADTVWEIEGGRVTGRHALLREGAAVRREGTLRSSDGATRVILAEILGVPGRNLPPIVLPGFPPAPSLEAVPIAWLSQATAVRWRWRWAAVVRRDSACELVRPELCEVTMPDGLRALTTWPPTAGIAPPPVMTSSTSTPSPGPLRVLLSPQAAAVLLHEAVGHPLEGDDLLRTPDSRPRRAEHTVTGVALDISDDPTRDDLPGAFAIDDEGVAASRRLLFSKGVPVGVLADRKIASRLHVAAGNARRASAHAFPRPRLSNLVVDSETPDEEPPREEAAIEVAGFSSGSLLPRSGEIRLVSRAAWRLHGGRRAQALAPFLLAGRVECVLNGIVAAGPSTASSEPGWCGKAGEVLPTGAVAPWLLVDGLEVR